MKIKFFVAASALCFAALFSACGPSKAEWEQAQLRIDSLQHINDMQRLDLQEISGFVGSVNESIDSIAQQEMELVYARENAEGEPLTRRQVMDNLAKFEMLLQRQHAHIMGLQDSLANIKASDAASRSKVLQLTKMIDFLNAQLAEKQERISELEAEIQSNKRSIADLQRNVSNLNQNVSDLESSNQALVEAAAAQDQMLNTGYYIVDTHKNLVKKDLATKRSIVSSSKARLDGFDKSLFTAVDIRQTTTFTFSGKKYKILSGNPENSYRITETSKNSYTLEVTNPTSFWTVPYLIIETD